MARYYDNANQAQRFQPGTTVRADEVDAKFDQVSSAFSDVESEVDRSLKLVNDGSDHEIAATATQRRNKVVGFDASGTMALLDGFTFRGDFAASTDYFVNDVIRDTTTKNLFVVDERHVSGSTRDDSKMSLAIDVDDVEAAKVAAQNAQSAAESAQSSAEDAQGYAEEWANRPEDSLITGAAGGDGVDDFSALHHANKASGSASAAATSESNASASESAAAASESAAATSETNASASETSAANSATAAATSESNAASSESAASTSETNAASSATSSANSAIAAATSESNAATSASNAATSESNAASSETAAASSASSASNSASAAQSSATAASSSANQAATSETNASNSATNAANSATAASASESAAATSESNAATSESNAATSESNAATSESNAANSASAALTSETNAANSASAAATSESNAATSAQNAADSFDSFDDRYLGSKTSEPTTDNDGDPLLEGALYYDSTSGALRFYDGTAWNTIATRSDAEIRALFSGSGDIVYNSSTGDFSVITYKSSDFDTDFSGKTTTDLTEGSNLYYTDTRARSAVSASGDLSYNAATGVFSFTETPNYTDADVDAHLTGGTGVTYNSGDISIGQDVSTTADVTFNSVSYDNSVSGLDATDVQSAIDETADETGLALIQDGVDPAVARAVAYNDIGAPVAGGYFAGVIDTIKGTIQANDDYQTGLRYAVIVAPKELEGGRGSSPAAGLTTGDLQWDTARTTAGEAGALTRWNGLEATNAIIAKNNTNYQVHDFIEECRNQYPAPATTGGSEWYLPAMDELELLYRNFKPNYADNDTRNFPRNFPGSQPSGTNPSSDPTSPQNSNNPRVPEKTPALGFRETEAAAVDLERYWSTTDADEDGRAWGQNFTSSGSEGVQFANSKDITVSSVRPVRRVVL